MSPKAPATGGNTELDASEVPFSFKDAPRSVDSHVQRVHHKAVAFLCLKRVRYSDNIVSQIAVVNAAVLGGKHRGMPEVCRRG